MPTITFTKTRFEAEPGLLDHCPPGSVTNVSLTSSAETTVEVVVTVEGEADAIEFMTGQGFDVTSNVP